MSLFATFCCCCCVLVFGRAVDALELQHLEGAWNLQDAEEEHNLSATVPGGIYTDLMANDVIGDVFFGFNDNLTRWVALTEWTYSRSFTVTQEFLAHQTINIIFDGLDTFASVFINDAQVGTTDNMFVRYIFDAKPHLQLGENTVTVKFSSPVETAVNLYDAQAENYVVPPSCLPPEYRGVCHANHVRKMQASFAWDWGPAFPSVGIWKPVYLEAHDAAVIRDVTVNTNFNGPSGTWDVQVNTYLSDSAGDVVRGTISVLLSTDLEPFEEARVIQVSPNADGEFLDSYTFSIPEQNVKLWWPNGYGDAVLYDMDVTFTGENGSDVSVKNFRVGFRTVRLVQEEVAEGAGTSFYFVVNNVPIFAKGANSIPIDVLPEKGQDPETIRFLLQSAKDVHMNMLRVWGGGVYEADAFYDVADELGILIWQDFMFACSMYPTNPEFLSTVKEEVKHQVRRLQHHASIILWAANNENEAALRQNWYGTADDFDRYKRDYVTLYVDTVRAEALKSDTSRQFLTSSPTNGVRSEEEGYVAENPASTMHGDVHYYNYVNDSWDKNVFPVTRFASEYGYQSFPALSTLLTATDDVSDLQYNSNFMAHRQHHPGGNEEIKALIEHQLNLVAEDKDNFYKAYIFYSQVVQAMAYKQQTEYYRLWRSSLNENGEGFTMGALYWQLNDVWVAPTWSGIDFKNNWKMVHYFAKNFFAPVIITGHLQPDRNLRLFAVSDLITNVIGASAKVLVFTWSSFEVAHEEAFAVDVLGGASNEITSFSIDEYLSDVEGCGSAEEARFNCFIHLTLEDADGDKIAPDNQLFAGPLKSAELGTPGTVQILEVRSVNSRQFQVDVGADKISLFVWLDSGSIRGRFSDNGFLQTSEVKTIDFASEQETTAEALLENVKVTHLLDEEFLEPSAAVHVAICKPMLYVVFGWHLAWLLKKTRAQ